MKANALAKVLETYAAKLPQSSAGEWATLARLFNSAKTKAVGDFCHELAELADLMPTQTRGLGELSGEIPLMQAMAFALGKAPLATALEDVRRLITQHPGVDLQTLENAVAERLQARQAKSRGGRQSPKSDPSVVPSYERRLEDALGDDAGFGELVARLEADRRLTAAEFKQLAKAFTGRAGKSKTDAIEAIKARHRNLMDARAKQRFNAGQTAA